MTAVAIGDRINSCVLLMEMRKGMAMLENSFFKKGKRRVRRRKDKRRRGRRKKQQQKDRKTEDSQGRESKT